MDKLINQIIASAKYALMTIVTAISYIGSVQAMDFQVIGNVSKGTCDFITTNNEVKFSQSLFIPSLKVDVDDKTYVKSFVIKYNCADFELSEGAAPFLMKVTTSVGSITDPNNKIYPTVNTTNAAFVLSRCDAHKQNCKVVDINSGGVIPISVTANQQLESNFEVSVVRLGAELPKPGSLVVAVDITLVQP